MRLCCPDNCCTIDASKGCSVGMNENTYGDIFLFLIGGILGSLWVIDISKHLNVLSKPFTLLRKNTLVIMGFNYLGRTFITELFYLFRISGIFQ